ncbi:MAG: class I SAM-dependent methyltransferase [Candidatus Omnitrophica bacterium]|nr:class I SAM-dependent methyltransferase [Candidatus Omnitrophota bacterium]
MRTKADMVAMWQEFSAGRINKNSRGCRFVKYRVDEIMRLCNRWDIDCSDKCVLKTDLWDETDNESALFDSFAKGRSLSIGTDISFITTKRACDKTDNKQESSCFIVSDVRNLPLADESIDIIFSHSTHDHFENRSDLFAALKELNRVLKKDGELIITLNNARNINFLASLYLERMLGIINYPIQFYSLKGLMPNLRQIGFRVIGHGYVFHVMSPLKTISLSLEKIAGKALTDKIVLFYLKLAELIKNVRVLNPYTGCYLALHCKKTDNGSIRR